MGTVSLSINLTDEYGMEWDPKFRIFSEEPVPKSRSYIARSKSMTKKPVRKPKKRSKKKSKKRTSNSKSRTIRN